jgi:glutamate synthase (NADPH/NADH) large chain
MVDLDSLESDEEIAFLRDVIARHVEATGSTHAARLLAEWAATEELFVKVMPRDYKRVLQAEARARAEHREPAFEELVGVAHG